jgi:hypothetical protein
MEETQNKTITFNPTIAKRTNKLMTVITKSAFSLPISTHEKIKTEKERSKRVITETKRWEFTPEELTYNNQLLVLNRVSLVNVGGYLPDKYQRMIYSQIKAKLRSYKDQDLKKNKYDSSRFVTVDFIIGKLKESLMICFYCKEPTNILYEYVREPKQWTIERLDNTYGHNCENVVIACLSCNLRRRTTHFERYLSTKRICAGVVKLDGDEEAI